MNDVHLRVTAGGEHYALSVSDVLAVSQIGEVAPVPGAPPQIVGVRNLRGRIIPVIDLAAVLGLTSDVYPEWIVVCESRGRRCAFAVTETLDIAELRGTAEEEETHYLSGSRLIDGALVGVADVTAILDDLSPAVTA